MFVGVAAFRTILIYFVRVAKKDKEDLEELSTELELADEDELVPYVFQCCSPVVR